MGAYDADMDAARQRMRQLQQEFDSARFTVNVDVSRYNGQLDSARRNTADTTDEVRRLQQEITRLQSVQDNAGGGLSATELIGGVTLSGLLAKGAEAFISGLTSAIGESINLASDLVEVQNVVDVTFKDSAETINAWAQSAYSAYGLTETKAKQYSSTLGAMLKSMGIADNQVAQMSMDMAGLAADMASFYNLNHDIAFEKIRSGISGETEPLKALGINMSVANMNAYALSQGMDKTYDKMTQAEQATLRYQYLLEATKDAQGDFARTGDSYSNELRKLETNLDRIKTTFGKGLLQVVTPALAMLNGLLSDKTYQQTEAERILSEQRQALTDSEVAYASALNIVNAMRDMESEGGDAVKSTDAWRDALESLKQVMPGLAQYVDLTTDAIMGNTDAVDAYVNSIHDLQIASVFEETVANAESVVQKTKNELEQALALKATLEFKLETANTEEVKSVYKSKRDELFAELKSSFDDWTYGDTWEEFVASDAYRKYSSLHNGQMDLGGAFWLALTNPMRTTPQQDKLISEITALNESYLYPEGDLQAQLDAQNAYIAELEQNLAELENAYGVATAERDAYYASDEGKAGKLQLEFQQATDAEMDALDALINAYENANTIRADTLTDMQKQYRGVASGMGFMVKHTKDEMEELLRTTYSKENISSWWGDNAIVLNTYNEQLKQAQANGVDVGILQNLLTYSTENEAILAQILEMSQDPEALAQLNADYQRSREAEQAIAETATEIALGNNGDYQEAVQAVHDFYDAFNQADSITTSMAQNNEAALAGIDAYGKAIEEKLALYTPMLQQLYGITPTTGLTQYSDFGGQYSTNVSDTTADNNAKNARIEKATVVPIDVDYSKQTSQTSPYLEKPMLIQPAFPREYEMHTYAQSAMMDEDEKPVNAGIGAPGTGSIPAVGESAFATLSAAIKDASNIKIDFVRDDFLSDVLDKAYTTYDNPFETATSAIEVSSAIADDGQREAFVQNAIDKFASKIEEITQQTNFVEAPNLFAQPDNVLKVEVVNPEAMATNPTIENTFSVDGEAIATAIAPRVNGSIGSGMRVNLMRTKWGDY